MTEIRVFNPTSSPLTNPRQSKPWTLRQAASRKDLAERFARDVLEDDGYADEIAAESPEDYAASRHKEIKPQRRRNMRTTNPRKSRSGGNGNGSMGTNRSNPSRALGINQTGVADPRLVSDLLDDVGTLKAQKKKLQDDLDDAQGQLDDISDVVACTDPSCDPADHLSEIQSILDGDNGSGDRDDDD